MKVKQMTKRDREKFFEHISEAKNILIITHREMDHDAVTSALLTRYILHTHYHKDASIIIQDKAAPTFSKLDLPDIEIILNVGIETPVDTTPFDLILMVDARDLGRCITPSEKAEIVLKKTISIDHHLTEVFC